MLSTVVRWLVETGRDGWAELVAAWDECTPSSRAILVVLTPPLAVLWFAFALWDAGSGF